MAWDETMVTMLRVMVGDLAEVTYTDDTLIKVLLLGAFHVQQELTFAQAYEIDIENDILTPDPTVTATKDDSFVNLVCQKSACILDRNSAMIAANRALFVKDGSSAIDLRGILAGKLKILEKGWCAVFDDSKMEYLTDAASTAGAVVMSPFRLFAGGSSDHRGRDIFPGG